MTADDLRSRIEWGGVQSCFDDPIFSAGRTAELLLVVGRPAHGNGLPLERVQEELREITAGFAFRRWHELQPSVSKQDGQAAKLAHALGLALETVGFKGEPNDADLVPMFGPGGLFAAAALRGEKRGDGATMNALRAVWLLRQDALKMREIYSRRQRMKGDRTGREEERAIKILAQELSTLYWLTWLESPGVALTDEGGPNSPFMRLFVTVKEALRERIGEPCKSTSALAKTWSRLDDHEKLKFHSGVDGSP